MGPVGNAQEQHELVDFGPDGLSGKFQFGEQLGYAGVLLARGILQPNFGNYIAFSKMTVTIHEGAPTHIEWRPPEHDRTRSSIVNRGGAMLVDAGVPVWKRWVAPRSIFAFAIDDAFVHQVWRSAFEGAGNRAIQTVIDVDDPITKRICDLARRELGMGGADGRLYIEGLATALTVHLLRTHATPKPPPMLHRSGLAPMQLRRVVDFIATHLGDEIALADLAAIAELSTHHFGEAFKTSMGRPPYRYLLERRVERARELLSGGNYPIAQIAYAAGFSSQAHLTTNFRRATGLTPSRFRRSLG
jgi:AraC family transcriptional regulator